MYIIIAILAFGILIADHEFGHFIAAKACGVKVNEFSIGMGPAIYKKQGEETLYTIRCLPIGGYCAMEGESEDSNDSRAFNSQSAWKKVIILVAGAAMNFLLGVIIIIILYSNAAYFASSTVVELVDGFMYAEDGIEVGDTIYSIDGHRIYYSSDVSTYLSRAGDTMDIVVIRDGEKVRLTDYTLKAEYYMVDGEEVYRYGLSFGYIEATTMEKLKYSLYQSYNFVRIVWMSLGDLVTGEASVNDLSGVVGVVATINEVAEESASTSAALQNIAYLCAFIAVNLAVMNMLPIPALDGGRVFFLILNLILEKLVHRSISTKVESVINGAGLALLMCLMVYVMFNDVVRLVN